MAVCSWCLCCGKVSTLITLKVHCLNVSSKDRLHLPTSPLTPSQSSCHAVLSDTPAGAYNSSMFREYFLITFSQVLVAVLSGALWVPYLSTFPSTLILSSIATFLLSFVITKLGPIRYQKPKWKGLVSYSDILYEDIFSRYLFGLPPPRDSMVPGKACRGFVPCFILAAITIILWSSLNIYRAYAYWENNKFCKRVRRTNMLYCCMLWLICRVCRQNWLHRPKPLILNIFSWF